MELVSVKNVIPGKPSMHLCVCGPHKLYSMGYKKPTIKRRQEVEREQRGGRQIWKESGGREGVNKIKAHYMTE